MLGRAHQSMHAQLPDQRSPGSLPQIFLSGTPIAEYLLVLPPVHARVPALRTASYGHQVAFRLGGDAQVVDVGPVASQVRSPVLCPGAVCLEHREAYSY